MDNKNIGLAFTLVFAIYLAYVMLFPAPEPVRVEPEKAPAVQTDDQQDMKAVQLPPVPQMVEPDSLPEVTPVEFQNIARRELVIENGFYRAVLTNYGGKIKQFELKKFRATQDSDSPNILLVDADSDQMGTLGAEGKNGFFFASNKFYQVSEESDLIQLGESESRKIVFKTIQGKLLIEKIFTFYGDGYPFDLDLRLTNLGEIPLSGGFEIFLRQTWQDTGKKGGFFSGGSFTFVGTATLVGDNLKTDSVEDLAEAEVTYEGDILWTSFEDKYFIKALVPVTDFESGKIILSKGENGIQNRFLVNTRTLGPGQAVDLRFLGYFGPRDTEIMKQVGHQLEEAVDFGFFHLIAKPLLEVLKFFNRFVGNYGVSIIILTLLIKMLFWPLTQKSYTSMKAMQKVQPEMAKIRVKYKNDKARLNKEVMELYRKYKVNPLGGCLPMVIQIPVFFALYKVLLEDIGLRHAPFMFWIQDLSAKDPYYITPIIMGATMFVQQKLTPTTMDSTQAKVLQYMPLIFTFMFLNFPSGLVLYWLVNNLLTIFQQYLVNKKSTTVEA